MLNEFKTPEAMKIISSLQELHASDGTYAIALGVFDGVHLGHRAVIQKVLDHSQDSQALPAVLTFEPHPIAVIAPERAPQRILASREHKRALLAQMGIEAIIEVAFTPELANIPAEEFAAALLGDQQKIELLSVGDDWRFGQKRLGNISLLSHIGTTTNTQVHAVSAVLWHDERISSTRIRSAIRDGKLDLAEAMLGRRYSVMGTVVLGRQLGRQLGTPTANLSVGTELLPPSGVYRVRAQHEGKTYDGVANLGLKPTVKTNEDRRRTLEVHLFDFDQDIYDESLSVTFHDFLRPEQKFNSLEALKAQIQSDIAQAKSLH